MEYEYNQIAKFYNAYAHTQRWLLEFVEDMLIENHIFSGTIIDLGCGSGVLFEYLEDSLQSIGVDIAEELLNEARKNAPHGKYIHADITTYKTDSQVDVVTCLFDTMNHLTTEEKVIKVVDNMSDMLKTGGIAIFDMLGKEEMLQLAQQSFTLPIDTDFGTAYFQAHSEEGKIIEWQIDAYTKQSNGYYHKDSVTFQEHYYDLKNIYAYVQTRFTYIQIYNAAGEKLQKVEDTSERIFFVCRK